jgi:uncharacterized protein YjeT (DUF2065 family)
MDWTVLLQALCLVFVVEGIPLFLAPQRVRVAAAVLLQMNDRALRLIGLVSMMLGASVIFLLAH